MKWQRFFLIILFVPHLIFGFDENNCDRLEEFKKNALKTLVNVADANAKLIPANQKQNLADNFEKIKKDYHSYLEKGLKRNCYELQKQALPILERLIDCCSGEELEDLKKELNQLREDISSFEKDADDNRINEIVKLIPPDEFKLSEKVRKDQFFKNASKNSQNQNFKNDILCDSSEISNVIPLDGQICKDQAYQLYTEQFYRFLIQSHEVPKELLIEVFEGDNLIHTESIPFIYENSETVLHYSERYLNNGVFIPETKLKSEFGFDLRLTVTFDPIIPFSMILTQKSNDSKFHFSISTDRSPLYESRYILPPPWQLESLKKTGNILRNDVMEQIPLPPMYVDFEGSGETLLDLEQMGFPPLAKLLKDLKHDPLAIASFVQNEINFTDPYQHVENGILYAPCIHRNPCTTYLEREGSPWEQCQLLFYLLRQAGYQTFYALGDPLSLPKSFVEKLLLTKLDQNESEALLKYPWVVFFDGNEWISLFPWMKEIEICEGYNIYNILPEAYATADLWILEYLKGNEKILKHIGPDGDDTAGVLFLRFLKEELIKKGLSLEDVGIKRKTIKKQFSSWNEFPHPALPENVQVFSTLSGFPWLFAMANIEVVSQSNALNKITHSLPLANLNLGTSFINFSPIQNKHLLHLHIAGQVVSAPLELNENEQLIDINILCEVVLGSQIFTLEQSFPIAKGAIVALCAHYGGASPKMTSQYHEKFSKEIDEKWRLAGLLSFVGASYFEKCSRVEKILSDLHKVNPSTVFAFGLAKLSPDFSKGPYKGIEDLSFPQVDMFWFHSMPKVQPVAQNQELFTAKLQCENLVSVDSSSNEHQILREVFKDPYAISTVKLLQLAHQEQQKIGEGIGFLKFTKKSMECADKTPETAECLHFPHLKDLDLKKIKSTSLAEWNFLKKMLGGSQPWSPWVYAYMTPGLTCNQDGTYKELGILILSPYTQFALISGNNLIFHGGLGSAIPKNYVSSKAISEWQLIPSLGSESKSYSLNFPFNTSAPNSADPNLLASNYTANWLDAVKSAPQKKEWNSDIRPENKNCFSFVSDPVDTISGAFYVDETDLILPGSFPLSIRRNYNSQNPIASDLGCGWKLSLNPHLIEQDGKRFAAELDGTVIAYAKNENNDRWEVLPENNPELFNFNQNGVGSIYSLYHSYIENDILYGADGSKRYYEDGLLQKYEDSKGNYFSFLYELKKLSRIESSNGNYFGIYYNYENHISEIYVRDGRRISYEYDSLGNLSKVILPNTAEILYEYDRHHRIIRETKPHGKVLENIYDGKGRVIEQRSPMGPSQSMVVTAIFEYHDDKTIVRDAEGSETIYQIYKNQIYKVTDPLGFVTLQSWFVDNDTWFDAEKEQIAAWNQQGGAFRSLKSMTDKRGLITSYLYDTRGNPEKMTIDGEDLNGDKITHLSKTFTYNDKNLCTKEEAYNRKTCTTYDQNFPFLPKKIEQYFKDTLTSYIDFTYNLKGELEKEDDSGSITFWKYQSQGFPSEKTQMTGTDDPDVVATFDYNLQGQCIKIRSSDGIQESKYDIMGNQIESKIFSSSLELISASYLGFDLNNAPIWKHSANTKNIVYLDYHVSGQVKAKRQALSPSQAFAYSLYEYSPGGYLIEETDPRGFVTYRDYDALGRVKAETKEGCTTEISYEAGGLVNGVTSACGAKTTRFYTTNGLLKEEILPDDTKNTIVYDSFGRPILQTANEIGFEIHYDDANHRIIKTHVLTKLQEISEFDMRGNLIKFTDAAGYVTLKTYDGLNRLKTKTLPSGKTTSFSYVDNFIICSLPNGEQTITEYVQGQAIKTEVLDSNGFLMSKSSMHIDAKNDKVIVSRGDEITTTWKDALGNALKIENGNSCLEYQYDACGNCVCMIDAEGKITHQKFDGLGRLIEKELPDGAITQFVYDHESNLCEYHLPNGNIWKVTYDLMQRKTSEGLFSSNSSTNSSEYVYENGRLIKTIDPMQRVHEYTYDSFGRVLKHQIEKSYRQYFYNERGFLTKLDQLATLNDLKSEHSCIERSYDVDGHLEVESIFLNSKLHQQSHQKWTVNSRTLKIGNHKRDFIYQNNQLKEVSTGLFSLGFVYDINGSLKKKNGPLSSTTIDYNTLGLPVNLITTAKGVFFQESLQWNASNKLIKYEAPNALKEFSYNKGGRLITCGSENYSFDFEEPGIGVLTDALQSKVPQGGLDDFDKVLIIESQNGKFSNEYDVLGQIIKQGQKNLSWDVWGRLSKVDDPDFSWEASYDALGRRLQTRYATKEDKTLVTNSFYDPEIEFQEIGIQIGEKTFWKYYGPNACEVISDEEGCYVNLLYNALRQLIGVISNEEIVYTEKLSTAYGVIDSSFSISYDLASYALSLVWQSKSQDPTGFIWMGDRYYYPNIGSFLSQDVVSYPISQNLYTYANGDPINYFDPDGRFASSVYETVKPVMLGAINAIIQPIKFVKNLCNLAVDILIHRNFSNTERFQIGLNDLSNVSIDFVNGVNNTKMQARSSAEYLSQFARGSNINVVYNATNLKNIQPLSITADVFECAISRFGICTPSVQELKNEWNHFNETNPPELKKFVNCHSGGASHVKNALLSSPEAVRQRIIVLAIAPSEIIPEELCFKSYNYMSRRDFVTHLDVWGKIAYGNQLNILKPDPKAKFWDHEFISPTFKDKIEQHTNEYIKTYGGLR